jgi:hypothetical protein
MFPLSMIYLAQRKLIKLIPANSIHVAVQPFKQNRNSQTAPFFYAILLDSTCKLGPDSQWFGKVWTLQTEVNVLKTDNSSLIDNASTAVQNNNMPVRRCTQTLREKCTGRHHRLLHTKTRPGLDPKMSKPKCEISCRMEWENLDQARFVLQHLASDTVVQAKRQRYIIYRITDFNIQYTAFWTGILIIRA